MKYRLPLFAACLLIVTCHAADQRFGALAPNDRVVTNEDDAAALAYAHAVSNTLDAAVAQVADSIPTSTVFGAQQAGQLFEADSNAWIVLNQGTGVLFTVTWSPTPVPDYTQLVFQYFWGQFDNGGQTPQSGDVLAGTPGTGPWSISYGDGSCVTMQGDGSGGWILTTAWGDASYWNWGADPVNTWWYQDQYGQWEGLFSWGTALVGMPVTNAVNLATVADTGAVLGQEQADVAYLQGEINDTVSQEQTDVSNLGLSIAGATQKLVTAVQGTNIAKTVTGTATQGMFTASQTTNMVKNLVSGRSVLPAWTNASSTNVLLAVERGYQLLVVTNAAMQVTYPPAATNAQEWFTITVLAGTNTVNWSANVANPYVFPAAINTPVTLDCWHGWGDPNWYLQPRAPFQPGAYTNAYLVGGSYVTNVGSCRVHVFTNSGSFWVTSAGLVDVFCVGGGGAGNGGAGGGGGGGWATTVTACAVSPGCYFATVGVGSAGFAVHALPPGGTSTVFGIDAPGGGGGGPGSSGSGSGGNGATGGGGGFGGAGGNAGGVGLLGFNGGSGSSTSSGGGGGCSSAGAGGSADGGAGGYGVTNTFLGVALAYGGGGGGATGGGNVGLGRDGGGSGANNATPATAPRSNSGGGGGAANWYTSTNYSSNTGGAAGIVIIRYRGK